MIVIPVAPDETNEHRRDNYNAVLAHLKQHFGMDVWTSYGSRAAARNNLPPESDDPVIVFNDADSICPADQILAAIALAQEAPGLVFAYDLYLRLSRDAVYEGAVSFGRVEQEIFNSGSMACVAISRACFEEVGGFDESYVGWGYEDLDFAMRCNALWPNRRVPGPVYHLWHGERNTDDSPTDSDPEQVATNKMRWLFGNR